CIFDALGIYADYYPIAIGLAVGLAIIVMMVTGTIHPPGGATALTCVLNGYFGAELIFRPVMLGVVLMMIVAYGANYLKSKCEKSVKDQVVLQMSGGPDI
ncbi:MAG: HPP family protein, partial [Candidatus Methanomethylophilaceae archaeon]|nr:HPP family protein [Candidatus Methanomethylophilaceae archaeon]